MKIAIVGSRNLQIDNIYGYLPKDIQVTEVISGGVKGIDLCARDFAERHHLKLTEFLPNYDVYGKAAPIRRNEQIVDYADRVLAFWDGISKGTKYVIDHCKKKGKPITVFQFKQPEDGYIRTFLSRRK